MTLSQLSLRDKPCSVHNCTVPSEKVVVEIMQISKKHELAQQAWRLYNDVMAFMQRRINVGASMLIRRWINISCTPDKEILDLFLG